MKKKALSLISLLLVMMLGVLASCDKEEEITNNGSTDNTTGTVTETENVTETVKEEHSVLNNNYDKTIVLADNLSGQVNASYSNNRKLVSVSNGNAVIEYPLNMTLMGDGAIRTPDGREYLSAISRPFIKNTSGDVFFSSEAASEERMNIYRLGSYYYEIHMLDGTFGNFTVADEQKLELSSYRSGNDIGDIKFEDDVLSYKVTSTVDPYLKGSSFKYSTDIFNALEITMSSTDSDSGTIYLAAGKYSGFNGTQHVNFTIIPDGEFHTYYVPFSAVPDYTGDITNIRLDVGKAEGETVRISSLKLVGLAEDAAPAVKLDRTYHLYSDKVNEVIRLVANKKVSDLASFGTVTDIPADTVDKLIIKDKNGTHTSLDGVDFSSVEYVAFDIKGVGIYGHILLPDESSGIMTVVLEDGNYVITQEYTLPENTVIGEMKAVLSGHRIYTDEAHSFDGFLTAAMEERNPLSGVTVAKNTYGAEYVGYDAFRGAYVFDVKGVAHFQTAYDKPYKRFAVSAAFDGIDADRNIYVITHTASGFLESGALLSHDGLMLPVDLEVCKNFCGENEEPFYDNGDTAYGEIIFPITVEAEKETAFHVINLYQNWGAFPLKQLSSIQFIAPYYHLSVGTTETNCIAPYYVYGKDHWTLPDFRAMSAPLWSTQPQHTSVGRLYFLEYTTADGTRYASESIDNKITSYGPTYCDIDMNYLSDDGKIKAYYRHMEMPHTDENRTYYELVLEVQDSITINDFKNDFAFFSFDGRNNLYNKLGYLNDNNECVITNANMTAAPNYITLGDKSPYISYFDGPETDDLTEYVNFALAVKNYSFTIGGEAYDGNLILRDVQKDKLNRMSLTLDLGNITLQKGDKFVINMILLPWGDPSAENDDNVRNVREDSCLDPYKVEAAVGSVIEDVYLPRVMSDDGTAEFTLSGGTNNCVVRVYGFDKLTVPTVMEKIDGNWETYKLSSDVYDYDGYTVYYDGDGAYSYAFVVDMSGESERTFKVTAGDSFIPLEGDWLTGHEEKIELPLNVYVNPENEKAVGAALYNYGCTMETAEDLSYYRFYGNDQAVEAYVTPVRSLEDYDSTGQYIVFKYRIPTTNSIDFKYFDVFTSTVNSGPKAEDCIRTSEAAVLRDGSWHVIVIDASAIKSFKPEEDGSYLAKYLRVDIINFKDNVNIPEDCYIDIAYFGMSDSIEDICSLNSDMETVSLYQKGKIKTINTATGTIN